MSASETAAAPKVASNGSGGGALELIAGRCLTEAGEEMVCSFEATAVAEMRVVGPEALMRGGVLICYIGDVGIVLARVMGESPAGGWSVKPIVAPERKERLAARLAWHRERSQERAEQRAAPRIVPLNRRVIVQLGERLSFKGSIQNLSLSGAAISLNSACVPYAGSVVRVGRREATVVRVTADGIAVRFRTALPAATFDERIIL